MSLSVIIPCYNEEGNLPFTVSDLLWALNGRVSDFEIIIVNDGSSDRTGEIASNLAQEHPEIRVLHHSTNRGLGSGYFSGVGASKKEFVITVFGDNEVVKQSLTEIFDKVGSAEMVLPYINNPQVRPLHRRILSWGFTRLVNIINRKNIRYYNGPVVLKRSDLLKLSKTNTSFAYMAEIISKLLKQGRTYKEVPFEMRCRLTGAVHALKFRNLVGVSQTLLRLVRSHGN